MKTELRKVQGSKRVSLGVFFNNQGIKVGQYLKVKHNKKTSSISSKPVTISEST